MATKGKLFTGARARFSINAIKVGFARNVTVREELQLDPVEVMDNIEVEEFVPVAYRVTFSASMFIIIGETLKNRNWFPDTGQTTEEHLTNILNTGDLEATIEDTRTNETFATLEQVRIQSHNWTIDARGVVGEDVEFVAIRLKDESEV